MINLIRNRNYFELCKGENLQENFRNLYLSDVYHMTVDPNLVQKEDGDYIFNLNKAYKVEYDVHKIHTDKIRITIIFYDRNNFKYMLSGLLNDFDMNQIWYKKSIKFLDGHKRPIKEFFINLFKIKK